MPVCQLVDTMVGPRRYNTPRCSTGPLEVKARLEGDGSKNARRTSWVMSALAPIHIGA